MLLSIKSWAQTQEGKKWEIKTLELCSVTLARESLNSREQSSWEWWEGLSLALPVSNGLFKSARETRTTFSSSQPLKQRQQNFLIQDNGDTAFVWMQEKQHWTLSGRGLLPGRWIFLSGEPEAVGGQISLRLSPAQPWGALASTLGQVHTGHPCMVCPSLHFDK